MVSAVTATHQADLSADRRQLLQGAIAARTPVFATCEGARRRFRPYAIGYCGRGLVPSVYVYQFPEGETESAWRCIPIADLLSVVPASEPYDPPGFPAAASGHFEILDADLCRASEAA